MVNRQETCAANFIISTGNVTSQEVTSPGSEFCLWAQALAAGSEETSFRRISGQCVREQKIYAGGGWDE